jgi:cephalosporin-C deacetylase-like acetyl esterase
MQFTYESTTEGVLERAFELDVAGERVPGVLWSPSLTAGPRPLVLIGHGGGQHKRAPSVTAHAHRYASVLGFAVAAVDAPGSGERARSEQDERFGAELRELMTSGKPVGATVAREMARLALVAIPEWRATLDALQTVDFIGMSGPVGYLGVSMGGAIGVRLVASEPRIRAAILGLAALLPDDDALAEAASRVSVPVEFVMQWDDEIVSRDSGMALFEALGTDVKSLHANLGGHVQVPPFEFESWERFFARNLLPAG